jgi:thioredoxin-like negative regulator of GroEL
LWGKLARLAQEAQDWDRAITAYRRLAMFLPDDVNVAHNLAICLVESGAYTHAVKQLHAVSEKVVCGVMVVVRVAHAQIAGLE